MNYSPWQYWGVDIHLIEIPESAQILLSRRRLFVFLTVEED
jgi:hypothetical protein